MEDKKRLSKHYILFAEKCISCGDIQEALNHLYKAEKLFSSQRAKDLIKFLEMSDETAGDKTSNGRSFSQGRSRSKRRSPSPRRRRASSGPDSKDDNDIASIMEDKDYYKMLGVSRNASESDIRQHYLQAALRYHPDKNKAPGAAEVFKAIKEAYLLLIDPVQRRVYDTSLPEEPRKFQKHSFPQHSEYSDGSRRFETKSSTPRPQGRPFTRDYPPQQRGKYAYEIILFPLVPLILIFVIWLLGSNFAKVDPIYKMAKSQEYSYQRRTRNHKVPYFVKQADKFSADLLRFEAEIEERYILYLDKSCSREKQHREKKIWQARDLYDRELLTIAKAMKTPSCDILNDLYHRNW